MRHAIRITALTVLMTVCMVLPFLPGRYDPLAVPLSMMMQLLGIAGLLLVPVGAAWLVYEWRSGHRRKRFAFVLAALVASSVVWLLLSLAAMLASFALGVGAVLAWLIGLYGLRAPLRRLRRSDDADRAGRISPIPLYLVVVPAAMAIMRAVLAEPAAEFSRNRAIRNAAPLIAEIEQHRIRTGRYPLSLLSVHPDYLPGIMGIKDYRYEPSGEAYNLLFEQLSLRIGTVEIVMYNPRGEQAMASHALDVLQLSPEALALDRSRGHYAVHEAPQPNWKYFWFD